MKKWLKIILFGFLIWLIPFIISFLVFPFKATLNPLFESIMAVVVTAAAAAFSVLYLKKIKTSFIKEGIIIGVLWLAICIVIDLALFMEGPMKMTFVNYMMDIGLTYLIIPIITISSGFLLKYHK